MQKHQTIKIDFKISDFDIRNPHLSIQDLSDAVNSLSSPFQPTIGNFQTLSGDHYI